VDVKNTNGYGFMSLLAVLFIGLKISGVITWSWWWVLAPLWVPAVIASVILVCVGAIHVLTLAREQSRR
jgi:hypothetical protein